MDFGTKIRLLREQRDMTVRQLAELSECTPSFISQIERSVANPSINTLKKISTVLGVPLVYFFEEETPAENAGEKYIVRKDNRKRFKSNSEHTDVYLLTPSGMSRNIEMHLMTVAPGGKNDKLYTNQAEEVGYVLQGQLIILLGDEQFTVEEGDSVYIPGNIPHGWENAGERDAVTLWAVTPPIIRTEESIVIGEASFAPHPEK